MSVVQSFEPVLVQTSNYGDNITLYIFHTHAIRVTVSNKKLMQLPQR